MKFIANLNKLLIEILHQLIWLFYTRNISVVHGHISSNLMCFRKQISKYHVIFKFWEINLLLKFSKFWKQKISKFRK